MNNKINIYSNVFYFIAALLAYKMNKINYSAILLLLTLVSTLYHIDSAYYNIDVYLSIIVLFYSLFYLIKTPRREKEKITGSVLLFLMILFLYLGNIYSYNTYHPWAHVFGGLSCTLVALYGKY